MKKIYLIRIMIYMCFGCGIYIFNYIFGKYNYDWLYAYTAIGGYFSILIFQEEYPVLGHIVGLLLTAFIFIFPILFKIRARSIKIIDFSFLFIQISMSILIILGRNY